jgi:hypothetical protein
MDYKTQPDWDQLNSPALVLAYNEMIAMALNLGQPSQVYRTISAFTHGLDAARTRCGKMWETMVLLLADAADGPQPVPQRADDLTMPPATESDTGGAASDDAQTKEVSVSKSKSKKKTAAPKKASGNGARAGSKTEVVAKLLMRSGGCTTADILKATGWPAVSVPALSKAAGLKLRKEKEKGSPTRYYGA